MTVYTFQFIALDSNGEQMPNAVGSFYGSSDTAFVTPIEVTAQDGTLTTTPTANRLGLVTYSYDGDDPRGHWKSGAQSIPVVANEAADTAAAAAVAAQAAAEAAAANTIAPTEDLVQSVVVTEVSTTGSTVRTALDANYAPMMVGKVLQATGVAGTDDANLASEATAAAAFGIPLQLIGDFRLQGSVTITGPIEIRGQGATITQTAHLVKGLKVDGNNVKISGIDLEGIPSDWVNNTTVYGAGGILVLGTASDVTIENCIINGFAGSSVMINSGASNTKLLNNTLTGPGATIIPQGLAGQEGIAIYNESSGSFVVEGNDISGYAQGMITIPSENYRIVNNLIHDIPGQHGMYLHLHTGAVIEGNQVWNTGLNGMKLQMDVAADADITDVVVSGNIFRQTGDAALVVTNTGTADPSRRGRRIVISNNVVTESGTNTSSGDGITVDHCAGVIISGNIVTTAGRNGIHVDTCSQAKVFNNLIDSAAYDGILLNATSDWEIGYNRVKNSATSNNSSNEYGIQLTNGSGTTTDGVVRGNIVTDANANMRYGIYVTSADLPNIDIIDNAATGATDYGFRGLITPTAARSFARNRLAGSLGAMLNPPTNVSPDSSQTFASVAADVTVTDSAALAAIPGLSLPVVAGATYAMEMFLDYLTPAAQDLQLQFTVPTGTTMAWTVNGTPANATSTAAVDQHAKLGAAGIGTLGGDPSEQIAHPIGWVKVATTAGSLGVTWAQNTVGTAVTSTIKAGTWLKLTRIA